MELSRADREKQTAALSSVIAAVGLATFIIIVGMATGSLGKLTEAAHSGLDLVASQVTLFAVRVSGKPADDEHTYGHGKIENLSALFETLLLLITCVWIIYEAIQRLFFKSVEVESNIWGFLVMITSIIIDHTRSGVLSRAAKKHNNQALEADALHFSTDIWSSSVVIVGLFCLKLSEWVPSLKFLNQADATAALVVAMIVIYVRVRASGPQLFVDVHILVNPDFEFKQVHLLATQVEGVIQGLYPEADVTVHPAPNHCLQRISPLVLLPDKRFLLEIHKTFIRSVEVGISFLNLNGCDPGC